MIEIINYRDFWKQYLREHTKRSTRIVHYIGTILTGVSVLALGITTSLDWLAMIGVGHFALPWLSHKLLERNKPVTSGFPLWSLMGDWRMLGLAITGRLGPELEKARPKFARVPATKKPAGKGGLS